MDTPVVLIFGPPHLRKMNRSLGGNKQTKQKISLFGRILSGFRHKKKPCDLQVVLQTSQLLFYSKSRVSKRSFTIFTKASFALKPRPKARNGSLKGNKAYKPSLYWYNLRPRKKKPSRRFKVTFLGWLSDLFKGVSDLQLRDKKVTLNHLVDDMNYEILVVL